MHHCPKCQSERTRRSKRRGLVEHGPLTLVFLRPFRCEKCQHRFFRWPIKGRLDVPIRRKPFAGTVIGTPDV
jgi:hypothetical protein